MLAKLGRCKGCRCKGPIFTTPKRRISVLRSDNTVHEGALAGTERPLAAASSPPPPLCSALIRTSPCRLGRNVKSCERPVKSDNQYSRTTLGQRNGVGAFHFDVEISGTVHVPKSLGFKPAVRDPRAATGHGEPILDSHCRRRLVPDKPNGAHLGGLMTAPTAPWNTRACRWTIGHLSSWPSKWRSSPLMSAFPSEAFSSIRSPLRQPDSTEDGRGFVLTIR